ncbi:MAG: hypothetical protein WKG07_16630 [Hymenobacter sp.]
MAGYFNISYLPTGTYQNNVGLFNTIFVVVTKPVIAKRITAIGYTGGPFIFSLWLKTSFHYGPGPATEYFRFHYFAGASAATAPLAMPL